jgi:hypothetical protein
VATRNMWFEALVEVVCAPAGYDDCDEEEDDCYDSEDGERPRSRSVVCFSGRVRTVNSDEFENEVCQGSKVDELFYC